MARHGPAACALQDATLSNNPLRFTLKCFFQAPMIRSSAHALGAGDGMRDGMDESWDESTLAGQFMVYTL